MEKYTLSRTIGISTLLLTLSLLFATHFAKPVIAQSLNDAEEKWLANKTEIVFASQTVYPPFEFIDNYNNREGMCIELVRWIATEFGFKARFLDMSFLKAQEAILTGKADVLTSLFFSKERDKKFDFSQMTWEVPALIFVAGDRPDITGLKDLSGKRIAMQQGDYAAEFLQSKNILYQLIPTETFADAVDMVVNGSADAVIGDKQIVLFYLYSNNFIEKVKSVGEPLYIGQNCLGVRQGATELQSILNKGIKLARDRGVFSTITRKWIGIHYNTISPWYSQYLSLIIITMAGLLVFVCVISFWNYQLRRAVNSKTRKLGKREQFLTSLVENIPNMIFVKDAEELRFVRLNQAGEELLGYSREELIGKNDYDFFPKKEADFFTNKDRDVLQTKKLHDIPEETIQTKNKGSRVLHTKKIPLYDEAGRPAYLLGISEDITEKKILEDQLRKERENFIKTFETAPVGLLLLNANTEVTKANQTMANIVLRDPAKIIGQRAGGALGCLFSHEHEKGCGYGTACQKCPLRKSIKNVLTKGESIHGAEIKSTFLINGKHQQRWLSVNVEPILIDEKKHVIVAIDDITDRKKMTEALQESEERFRLVADYTYNWETWHSPEKELLYISPSCENISGYGRNDFYNDPELFEKIVHPDDQKAFVDHHVKLFAFENEACQFEFRISTKDGETKLIHHICQPVFSAHGEYLGRRGSNQDITERKALENELNRFKYTLDQAHDCVFMFAPDTLRFFYANQGAMQQIGYSDEELKQMTPLQIKPEFTEKSFRQLIQPLQDKKEHSLRFETVHKHKDGTIIPVDIFLQYVKLSGEEGRFVAVVRDISEQKKIEKKLREYAEQQKALLQEVNHRVKNNLTAIISMLHQEEDRAEDFSKEEGTSQIHEVIGRVEGLLIVHSLLSASKWKPLNLTQLCEEVISGTTAGLSPVPSVIIDITPCEITIDADRAHSLALVLSELSTNTIKYGQKNTVAWNIHVGIKKIDTMVQLTYQDDGPGFPDSVLNGQIAKRCIGINMISGIIHKNLGGTIELQNNAGAVITISYPASTENI